MDEIMRHSLDMEEPVTKIPKNLIGTAMKCFQQILLYCKDSGDWGEMKPMLDNDLLVEFLSNVTFQTGKFRDEIFIQLLKQLRQNNDQQSYTKAWHMLACLASCCSPSKEFLKPLMNYLKKIAENDSISAYMHWAKYVLVKVHMAYKLLVRRSFSCTAEECQLIIAQSKIRVPVYLMNGAFLEMWAESWETFSDLKSRLMQQLGLDESMKNSFGFLEVVERRTVYEERWLEEFVSCTENLGFFQSYCKVRGDAKAKKCKVYFTLKLLPKLDAIDPSLQDWVWLSMVNDFKRGKSEATNSDIATCVALVLQADQGSPPDKVQSATADIMKVVPVTRKSESKEYWTTEVGNRWKGLGGSDRSACITQWFEVAKNFLNWGAMQFTGQWIRCSDEDNHDAEIPEDCESVFLVKHDSLEIMNGDTKQLCVDLDLSEISNWGCSKDQFVYATGEAHARIKEYFKCPAATQVCWLLNVYAA